MLNSMKTVTYLPDTPRIIRPPRRQALWERVDWSGPRFASPSSVRASAKHSPESITMSTSGWKVLVDVLGSQ